MERVVSHLQAAKRAAADAGAHDDVAALTAELQYEVRPDVGAVQGKRS